MTNEEFMGIDSMPVTKEHQEKQTMMKNAVNYLTSIDFDHIEDITVEKREDHEDIRYIVDVTITKFKE